MCGRFALPMDVSEVVGPFDARPPDLSETPSLAVPRYNICPTQPVLTIRSTGDGREGVAMRWGFLPLWYKTPADGPLMINARSETLAEKPAFRTACRTTRCLIPAAGFYEWRAVDPEAVSRKSNGLFGPEIAPKQEAKTPYYFHAPGAAVFAFAGIWQRWEAPGAAPLDTCAIVTCAANAALTPIHHRMPVIIQPADFGLWLGEGGKGAARLMRPAAEDYFAFHPVGPAVNSAKSDAPILIDRV